MDLVCVCVRIGHTALIYPPPTICNVGDNECVMKKGVKFYRKLRLPKRFLRHRTYHLKYQINHSDLDRGFGQSFEEEGLKLSRW
jgi:hypothetical protein